MPLSHRIWLAFFLAFPVIAPIYQWRFPMFGVPTNALEILTILSIGIFIGLITRQRHHASRSEPGVQGSPAERREVWWRCCITKKSLTSPVALLFLAALISLTQATDTFSALGIIKSYIVLPSIVGGITWWVFQNAQARSTLSKYFPYSFALAATWMAYFAFVQVTNPILIPAPWRSELRATGPFPYPNALGHWLAPIAAYSIALLLTRERSLGNRLLLGATVLVSVWGITLSQTEAALIALFAIATIAIAKNLGKKIRFVFLGTCVSIGIIAFATIPLLQEKLLLKDWSGKTRITTWGETWSALTASPPSFLLGFGPNQYPQAMIPFHTHTYLEIFQYPHQLFLNFWVEFGLLGVCVLLWGVWRVVKTRPWQNHERFAAALALLGMCIHGLVDVPFFKNDLAILTAFLLAVTLAPFPARLEEK